MRLQGVGEAGVAWTNIPWTVNGDFATCVGRTWFVRYVSCRPAVREARLPEAAL